MDCLHAELIGSIVVLRMEFAGPHICDVRLHIPLQHYVLPCLSADTLGKLHAASSVLRFLVDEDTPLVWADAAAGKTF